jgi:hypothetical protein
MGLRWRRARSTHALYGSGSKLKNLLTMPIPYLAPLMVGALPLLFLHWLYQPVVLTNPGLSAYKAPVTTLLLPPSRSQEMLESAESRRDLSVGRVTEDFALNFGDEKPKSQPNPGGTQQSGMPQRFAGRKAFPDGIVGIGGSGGRI